MQLLKGTPAVAKYTAEFIGTCVLVFTIGCNHRRDNNAAAVSLGSVLMALVYALGRVSGAHFNPAVTIAVQLANKDGMCWCDALWYMASQTAGAIVGGFLYVSVVANALLLQPVGLYSGPQIAIVEVTYTAALCYVILNVLVVHAKPHSGIAIGFTVMAAVVAVGPISGCSLNPALAMGCVTVAGTLHGAVALQYYSLYLISPFLGSVLGAAAFSLVRKDGQNLGEVPEGRLEAPAARRQQYSSSPVAYAATGDHAPLSALRVLKHSPVSLPAHVRDHDLSFTCRWRMRPEVRRGVPVGTCDIDLSCVKFNCTGDCIGGVYFAEPSDAENGIRHSGDEITGDSARKTENELIKLRLSDLKSNVHALVFVVMVYTPGQNFGDVQQICVRLVDATDGNREICRYEKEDLVLQSNALIAAILYRQGEAWCFKAVDESFALSAHSSYRKLIPEMQEVCRHVLEPV